MHKCLCCKALPLLFLTGVSMDIHSPGISGGPSHCHSSIALHVWAMRVICYRPRPRDSCVSSMESYRRGEAGELDCLRRDRILSRNPELDLFVLSVSSTRAVRSGP
jgi:hypothetical protein